MITHGVSDFLIRIKNASTARRREVVMPYSNINKNIGKVLQTEGFLDEVKEFMDDNKRSLKVSITYEKRKPVLSDIKVVSKPSLRIYKGSKKIAAVERRGKHIVVLSTSSGIMTGFEAKKKGVGGEILFEIW